MISYKGAIDPHFGSYEIKNDIITMPFWKREFCDELVEVCEEYKDRFFTKEGYDTHELLLSDVSRLLFQDYALHFKEHVAPILRKEWMFDLDGMFSPFFLRYFMAGPRKLHLHNDTSLFTTSIKLNDDYEGCHIFFPRQNFSMQDVPVGHAVIWPSVLTHPHYVTELTRGVKYSFASFTWPISWTDSVGYKF